MIGPHESLQQTRPQQVSAGREVTASESVVAKRLRQRPGKDRQ